MKIYSTNVIEKCGSPEVYMQPCSKPRLSHTDKSSEVVLHEPDVHSHDRSGYRRHTQ